MQWGGFPSRTSTTNASFSFTLEADRKTKLARFSSQECLSPLCSFFPFYNRICLQRLRFMSEDLGSLPKNGWRVRPQAMEMLCEKSELALLILNLCAGPACNHFGAGHFPVCLQFLLCKTFLILQPLWSSPWHPVTHRTTSIFFSSQYYAKQIQLYCCRWLNEPQSLFCGFQGSLK